MYAIVEIAGHQYKVQKDQPVFVNRLTNAEGEEITLDKVMLVSDDTGVKVGAPVIEGASVKAIVDKHLKADKVLIFKKKRRKGYQKLNGFRQSISKIVIKEIIA
ncbi:MAG: 50S ribosomal protein L21 [Thermaurantimonas sp.]